jgi:hypothetical protein
VLVVSILSLFHDLTQAFPFYSHFNIHKTERGPKEIFDPEIQKHLLVLEEQEVGFDQIK